MTARILVSRNKREGGYCGKVGSGCVVYGRASHHYRTGPHSNLTPTLRTDAMSRLANAVLDAQVQADADLARKILDQAKEVS